MLRKDATLNEGRDQVNLTHGEIGSAGALQHQKNENGPNVKHGEKERSLL